MFETMPTPEQWDVIGIFGAGLYGFSLLNHRNGLVWLGGLIMASLSWGGIIAHLTVPN